MDKNDKKNLKYILQLLILGVFCKVGFDINGYLSIKDTIESTLDIILLVVLLLIIFILFCVVVLALFRVLNKKKDIDDTKNKIDRLESKMNSTRRNNRR